MADLTNWTMGRYALDMVGNVGEWVFEEKVCLNSFRGSDPLFICWEYTTFIRAKEIGFRCAVTP